MEILVMRGANRADCLRKITEKYGIHFTLGREKVISSRGFFGIGKREEVELEFYVSPQRSAQATLGGAMNKERQVVGLSQSAQFPGDDSTLDFAEAKKKVLAAAGRDPDRIMKAAAQSRREESEGRSEKHALLEKLAKIEQKLESGLEQKHPTLARMEELLRLNDFSDGYSRRLLERARRELPLEILDNFDLAQDRLLEWIGESISTFRIPERAPRKHGERHCARIMIVVGPAGVGKTTTIAKLAAIYGFENISRPRPILSVRVITIDSFRIGAQHQIEGFTKIIEIPVSFIDNHMDLQKEIDLYKEVTDLIIVDTTGRSPKDARGLGEMKQILDACGTKAEVHLALAAGTKTADMTYMMQQFEPFNYCAVLLTKLDETRRVGNVISALAEKDKPVSYVTNGQGVPRDIRKAEVVQFLINLEEFRVDRGALEKRFPSAENDSFQWS